MPRRAAPASRSTAGSGSRPRPPASPSSPWAYNGKIFLLSEDGDTFVVAGGPEFKLLGKNSLNEMALATPAVVRGSVIIRTQSKLYRIAKATEMMFASCPLCPLRLYVFLLAGGVAFAQPVALQAGGLIPSAGRHGRSPRQPCVRGGRAHADGPRLVRALVAQEGRGVHVSRADLVVPPRGLVRVCRGQLLWPGHPRHLEPGGAETPRVVQDARPGQGRRPRRDDGVRRRSHVRCRRRRPVVPRQADAARVVLRRRLCARRRRVQPLRVRGRCAYRPLFARSGAARAAGGRRSGTVGRRPVR